MLTVLAFNDIKIINHHVTYKFLLVWTKQPLQPWIYADVSYTPFIVVIFFRQCLAQAFVALALGQFSETCYFIFVFTHTNIQCYYIIFNFFTHNKYNKTVLLQ